MIPSHFAQDIISLINRACDAAARETLPRFRSRLTVTNKLENDFDPVTEGDRQAERAIRSIIENEFPDHGIVGEEFGTVRPDADYQWIIDPIDGTRAFICGLPVWGTLIGLYKDGIPCAGALDQPFTRERFISVLQEDSEPPNTTLTVDGGQPLSLRTRSTESLAQATLMTTSPQILTGNERVAFDRLEKTVKLSRYGCDCYAYGMVAAGHIDLVVESGLNIYDIAALIPIIEGAGGIVTSWDGGDASKGGSVLAAANTSLHKQAMEILSL